MPQSPPMDFARSLFDDLRLRQSDALVELLAESEPEWEFLEFKQSKTSSKDLARPRLNSTDKEHLAKALSGFANSRGGVLVWGVDNPNPRGVARGTAPAPHVCGVADADALERCIRNLVSSMTMPPLQGVDTCQLAGPDGARLVAVYVPQRTGAPFRAEGGLRHYYFRAGESFIVVPHEALAAMFGQRPPPQLRCGMQLPPRPPPGRRKMQPHVDLRVFPFIANSGISMAHHSFMNVVAFAPGPKSTVTVKVFETERYFKTSIGTNYAHFVARPGYPIPPGASGLPALLQIVLQPPFDSPLRIDVEFGAEDTLMHRRSWVASADQVKRAFPRLPKPTDSHLAAWRALFPDDMPSSPEL